MPRRKRRSTAQRKRRKLERDRTVPVDGSDSDDPTTVGSVTPQPQGSVVLAASPTVFRTRSVPVATTTNNNTVTAGAAIDDVEGTVISGVSKLLCLVSNIQFSKAAIQGCTE